MAPALGTQAISAMLPEDVLRLGSMMKRKRSISGAEIENQDPQTQNGPIAKRPHSALGNAPSSPPLPLPPPPTLSRLPTYKIIASLRESTTPVTCGATFSNATLQPQLHQAYARISGREWTYFVGSVEVVLGNRRLTGPKGYGIACEPDGALVTVHLNGEAIPIREIHLDLGPGDRVAPVHAVIVYVPEKGGWEVLAVGGEVRVDGAIVSVGGRGLVRSRSVIELAGTEMLFLLPGDESDSDEEEEDEEAEEAEAEVGAEANREREQVPEAEPAKVETATPSRPPQQNSLFSSPGIDVPPTTPGQAVPSGATGLEGLPADQIVATPAGLMAGPLGLLAYEDERTREYKPPFSYSQLIGRAILSAVEEQCTLAKIYDHIRTHYAYYRFAGGGWQNSIRHNLSLSRCFEKVARRTDEPGKGMKWRIVPGKREEVVRRGLGKSPRKDTRKSPRKRDKTPEAVSPGVLATPAPFDSPYNPPEPAETETTTSAGPVDETPGRPVRPSVTVTVATAVRRNGRSNLDTPLYKPGRDSAVSASRLYPSTGHGQGFSGATPVPARRPTLQPPSTAKLPSLLMELPSSPDGLIYRGRLVDEHGLPLFGSVGFGVDEAEADCAMQLLDLATSPQKRCADNTPWPTRSSQHHQSQLTTPGGLGSRPFTPLRAAAVALQRSSPPPFGRDADHGDRDRQSSPIGPNGQPHSLGGNAFESPIRREYGRDAVFTPTVPRLGFNGGMNRLGVPMPGSSPLRAILNPPESAGTAFGQGRQIQAAPIGNLSHGLTPSQQQPQLQPSHIQSQAPPKLHPTQLHQPQPPQLPRYRPDGSPGRGRDLSGSFRPSSGARQVPVPVISAPTAPTMAERSTLAARPPLPGPSLPISKVGMSGSAGGPVPAATSGAGSGSVSGPSGGLVAATSGQRNGPAKTTRNGRGSGAQETADEEIDLAKGFVRIGTFHRPSR